MSFLNELYQTGFFNVRRLACMVKAKQKHGDNLCFLLRYAAMYYGNRPALSDGATTLSFKELYAAMRQCSFALQQQTKSDKAGTIILLAENTLQHIIALYAIQSLGMRLVLVNAKTHPAEVVQIIKMQQGPCFVIAATQITNDTILLSSLFSNKNSDAGYISKKHAPVIYTTSGTTGAAKMIEKRKGAFYWLRSFTSLLTYTGIHKCSSVYIAVPVSHGFGSTALLFALVLGKKAVVGGTKTWSEQAVILQQEKVDLLAGVPASLYYLAAHIKGVSPVRLVISGGAPFTETVLQKIAGSFGTNIFSMYGSTEASTSFVASYAELRSNIHALGRPLKTIQFKLEPLQNGGSELCIKSGLANKASTDGWLHTGDMVCADKAGMLYWCGRKDDMIIKGGVNIYPAEIEAALLAIDGIEEAMVTADNHDIKGQSVIACIQVKKGFTINETALKTRLRETLSGIKIPDTIIVVDAFSYTSTGKKIKPGFLTKLSAK